MPTLFCRDCKWCRPSVRVEGILWRRAVEDFSYAKCAHPRAMGARYLVNPANEADSYCSVERSDYGVLENCGHAGKNWEPKP